MVFYSCIVLTTKPVLVCLLPKGCHVFTYSPLPTFVYTGKIKYIYIYFI